MLPPWHAAPDYKIKQSHFVSKVWTNEDKVVPFITDPENFGWKVKDNVYETVLTYLEPVLDMNAELSFCTGQTKCVWMCC